MRIINRIKNIFTSNKTPLTSSPESSSGKDINHNQSDLTNKEILHNFYSDYVFKPSTHETDNTIIKELTAVELLQLLKATREILTQELEEAKKAIKRKPEIQKLVAPKISELSANIKTLDKATTKCNDQNTEEVTKEIIALLHTSTAFKFRMSHICQKNITNNHEPPHKLLPSKVRPNAGKNAGPSL